MSFFLNSGVMVVVVCMRAFKVPPEQRLHGRTNSSTSSCSTKRQRDQNNWRVQKESFIVGSVVYRHLCKTALNANRRGSSHMFAYQMEMHVYGPIIVCCGHSVWDLRRWTDGLLILLLVFIKSQTEIQFVMFQYRPTTVHCVSDLWLMFMLHWRAHFLRKESSVQMGQSKNIQNGFSGGDAKVGRSTMSMDSVALNDK